MADKPVAGDGGAALAAKFDQVRPLTVGLEEELFLVEPESLELAPVAVRVLEQFEGDERFKPELPAAQLEILTPPCESMSEAVGLLAGGRRDLIAACESFGGTRPFAAGVHPFAAPEGELNRGERYDHTARAYGSIARRQLVCALQVHVAVGGAERARAVYNALRGHLPELAAIAANAPFHDGADTGLASVRPRISELLPRQGIPPPINSWDGVARELSWGEAARILPDPRMWWWELRPHPEFGTLEVRVPDAQTTLVEAAGVAAVVHCLVAWLARRHDEGEVLGCASSWRIAENRWLACRDGVEGELVDLETGERRATRTVLSELLDQLEPVAGELRCATELRHARALVEQNGALRQRKVAREGGLRGLVGWLADRFSDPITG